MSSHFLLAAVLFLAYTNGANDNFKGVATLLGSRAANFGQALAWATVTTFLGSLVAAVWSQGLVRTFSGRGLVPEALTASHPFLLAVALGAAVTVLLATWTGMPVSTTHALTGGLIGSGWMAIGPHINPHALGRGFLFPLAVSPLLALVSSQWAYPRLRLLRERMGVYKELCLCVGSRQEPVRIQPGGAAILQSTGAMLTVGEFKECVERYRGVLFGVNAQHLLDALHYLSAGAVGFARGLNDTPKMVALLTLVPFLSQGQGGGFILIAVAMAMGGLFNARRVARTMSQRITPMNRGQGTTANWVTSSLALSASIWGFPVSTTHLSCGALFGIGAASRKANPRVIRDILYSWMMTLPVAALLSAGIFWLIRRW